MSRSAEAFTQGASHSRRTDSVDPVEAREALDAAESVRARVVKSDTGEYQWAVLGALTIGLATFATLQGSLWGFLLLGVLIAGIIVHSFAVKKPVRAALKQDVRPDPSGSSWKTLAPLLIMYPLAMWLPQGNTAVSAIAGLCVAGGMLVVHYHSEKQKP